EPAVGQNRGGKVKRFKVSLHPAKLSPAPIEIASTNIGSKSPPKVTVILVDDHSTIGQQMCRVRVEGWLGREWRPRDGFSLLLAAHGGSLPQRVLCDEKGPDDSGAQ